MIKLRFTDKARKSVRNFHLCCYFNENLFGNWLAQSGEHATCSLGREFEPHVKHRVYFKKRKLGEKIRHLLYNQVLANDFRDLFAFLPGLMRKG